MIMHGMVCGRFQVNSLFTILGCRSREGALYYQRLIGTVYDMHIAACLVALCTCNCYTVYHIVANRRLYTFLEMY